MPNYEYRTHAVGLDTSSVSETMDYLHRAGRRGYGPEHYVSVKSTNWSAGRELIPTDGPKRRWFDKALDPDQLTLPFGMFEPVPVHSISWRNHYQWILTCVLDEGLVECDLNTSYPTESDNRILAIEVSRRREILPAEEPQDPFGRPPNLYDASLTPWLAAERPLGRPYRPSDAPEFITATTGRSQATNPCMTSEDRVHRTGTRQNRYAAIQRTYGGVSVPGGLEEVLRTGNIATELVEYLQTLIGLSPIRIHFETGKFVYDYRVLARITDWSSRPQSGGRVYTFQFAVQGSDSPYCIAIPVREPQQETSIWDATPSPSID